MNSTSDATIKALTLVVRANPTDQTAINMLIDALQEQGATAKRAKSLAAKAASYVATVLSRCPTELAFRAAIADCADDTTRLIYADWLEEQGRSVSAERLRWWVAARQAIRSGVVWDRPTEWEEVERSIGAIRVDWVRRLCAVETSRIVRERYPLGSEWKRVAKIADATILTAELYALGLATDAELSAAYSTAWNAADSTARNAADSAARSAAWSAAMSAAMSAASSAVMSAASSAAYSAAMSAASSAATRAAWSAARSAAYSIARILAA